VLFLGRLNTRRGPQIALPGFFYAINQNPNLELWIVGDGPLFQSLVKTARTSGLSNKVKFYGKKHNIRRILWDCDIFLATSPIANSPSLALREAMAAGLAIIATDVEDTSYIVQNNKTGILVPPETNAIGEAILKLQSKDKTRTSLSQSATIFAKENFSLDSYIKSLLDIYQS
jgi:glycosyltransferase involved in cell wall biosynthesis